MARLTEAQKWIGICYSAKGYSRVPNRERLREGAETYKKGWEARFVAETPGEADLIRSLLDDAGIHPGNAFPKGGRIVLPVYGREAVARILEWSEQAAGTKGR